jgi:hypothetical protein
MIPDDSAARVLGYLQCCLPGYPFDHNVDVEFVDELVEDFPYTDLLEEIKAFRWYHDNDPAARASNLRLAIRRWILRGQPRSRAAQ